MVYQGKKISILIKNERKNSWNKHIQIMDSNFIQTTVSSKVQCEIYFYYGAHVQT